MSWVTDVEWGDFCLIFLYSYTRLHWGFRAGCLGFAFPKQSLYERPLQATIKKSKNRGTDMQNHRAPKATYRFPKSMSAGEKPQRTGSCVRTVAFLLVTTCISVGN